MWKLLAVPFIALGVIALGCFSGGSSSRAGDWLAGS